MDPGNGHCTPDDGGKRGSQAPDPAYGNTNPDNSSPHHGSGGGGGGGSSHHSCGFFGCTLSNFAHKAYHAVTQHPVIAAVVATAVVVGVVACVVACAAVLVAGATGFTAGAEAGSLGAAAVGASVGVIGEGGSAVIAGSSAIAGAGAAAVAEGAETAVASKAATRSGARAADSAAEETASSGASKGGERADTAEPKSGASACNHSFLPATKVLMADGHEKQIKDIKAGDKVRATNPETGKSQSRTVEKLITTKHDKDFATISVLDGAKPSKIVATVTHPFWVDSKRAWIDAGHLKPGMQLHTASGLAAAISSVKIWHHQHLTHDLTVSVTHTYYVLAGDTPVLVHNCDTRPNFASDSKAQNHFSKHVYGETKTASGFKSVKAGPDMPEYQTPDGFNEYVDHARNFMNGPARAGDLVDGTGFLHRIDVANGLYGLRDPAGVISTFFRRVPDVQDYLNTQLAKYGGSIQ
ncbi:polymorphic toxin-type HINT domain-containing protein [Streptomyces mirabilis]|uniref:polymorphic toxin-type HINT domain-containing protein n=1 Tax=Streptomyces mirabilis TaxID=68239 RepID=UPI0036EC2800